MDETQATDTTIGIVARSDEPVSRLAALLQHLPPELHDDAIFRVGGVTIIAAHDGAGLSICRTRASSPDGWVRLDRDQLARLAGILDACHAAAGGTATARHAATLRMADLAGRLAAPGAEGIGLSVGIVMVTPQPDGAVLAIADGRANRRDTEAWCDLGELAQLASLLRACAGSDAGEMEEPADQVAA